MKWHLDWLLLLALLSSLIGTAAVTCAGEINEPKQLDVQLGYQAQRTSPVTHEIDFSVVITPPHGCRQLQVWLPLPQSDFAQQIRDSRLSTFPEQVEPQIGTEPVYGNQFAYFEFKNPRGAQIIRYQLQATVWDLRWKIDPQQIQTVGQWPAAFQPYLQLPMLSDEQQFASLLNEITREHPRGRDLLQVMNWIDANLTYDHSAASLRADVQHALTQRRGHCSDYHGLCAAMARKLGYPTRVTYGLNLYPKNSPSHCKLEAFLPPYGWVSFDLSETQKLVAKIQQQSDLDAKDREALVAAARERLERGFRENSWLLVTRGTDYELVPPASQPVRVVRTIYAEADGVPLPDPDPADPSKREFAWMTVHQYRADRPFKLPFHDLSTLAAECEPAHEQPSSTENVAP